MTPTERYRSDYPKRFLRLILQCYNEGLDRLKGESCDHVKTLETGLRVLILRNPGFDGAHCSLWNIDETKVDAEHGAKVRVFASLTSNSAFRGKAVGFGVRKHMTAIFSASNSGWLPPVLIILATKSNIFNWKKRLQDASYRKLVRFIVHSYISWSGVVISDDDSAPRNVRMYNEPE